MFADHGEMAFGGVSVLRRRLKMMSSTTRRIIRRGQQAQRCAIVRDVYATPTLAPVKLNGELFESRQ
jgi:hypothetical protein